jgi:hypothetical protein
MMKGYSKTSGDSVIGKVLQILAILGGFYSLIPILAPMGPGRFSLEMLSDGMAAIGMACAGYALRSGRRTHIIVASILQFTVAVVCLCIGEPPTLAAIPTVAIGLFLVARLAGLFQGEKP